MSLQTLEPVRMCETSPDEITRIAFAFMASKALLSAVELGVFTELARQPSTAEELRHALGLHARGASDLFDSLVALGLLHREDGVYRNSSAADAFLVCDRPGYIGGGLEMASLRLYPNWARLTTALRTGLPQNEVAGEDDPFATLYHDPRRLRMFADAMTAFSVGPAREIAAKFPWQLYSTFADVGCAQGCLPVQVALAHPHLRGIGYDLAPVAPIFEEYIARFGLQWRLRFQPGDMFARPLPEVDVLVFGHILHDWGLGSRRTLLARAYDTLPRDGAVIVYEALIDDDRRENAEGLLMSLNMLIETRAGGDFTGAECQHWMRDIGFRETFQEPPVGGHSMVVGIK